MIELVSKKEEIEHLLEEMKNVFNPPLTTRISNLSEYAEKLAKFANVYYSILDGEVCGFICFYNNDDDSKTSYISQLAVKERFQGKGIGQNLLDKCVEIAKKTNRVAIELEVDDENEKAISFYKKNGFVFIGKRTEFQSHHMRKIIS